MKNNGIMILAVVALFLGMASEARAVLMDCTLVDGILTVTGSGEFTGCSDTTINHKNATEVNFSMGVTSIGERAFSSSTSLRNVNMPSVTLIKSYAFMGATNLESVYMPNVTYLGQWAFANATSLTSVDIPKFENQGGDVFCISRGNTSSLQYIGRKASGNATSVCSKYCGEAGCLLSNCSSANGYVECGSCGNGYVMSGRGCVIDCGTGYLGKDGKCISSSQGCGEGYYKKSNTCVTDCGDGFYGADGSCNERTKTDLANCSTLATNADACAECSEGYKVSDDGDCEPFCDGDTFLYEGECVTEYPFAKKHYTPAEANRWLKDNDNTITLIFKK